MSYNCHNLAVHRFASKSSIRPEMQCVAFYGDRTLATDSFRLVEVSADGAPMPLALHYAHDVKARKVKKGESVASLDAFDVAPQHGEHYPDVDTVLAQEFDNAREYTRFIVNGEYLAEVVKTLADLSKYKRVIIEVPHAVGRPLRVLGENDKGTQKARALVMPMTK